MMRGEERLKLIFDRQGQPTNGNKEAFMSYFHPDLRYTYMILALGPANHALSEQPHPQWAELEEDGLLDEIICKKKVDRGYFLYGLIDGRWQAVFRKATDDEIPDCDHMEEHDPRAVSPNWYEWSAREYHS